MGALFPATVLALVLAAQQAGPGAQPFRTSIDVVRVDVSAIDGTGRPIRDLTAGDFELRVDGRSRKIVSAQFVTVPPAAEPTAPAAAAPAAPYSSNADAAGGRLIMVVVDRSSIVAGRGRAAIEAASRFVRQLNRADRVALATIPHGPQVTFTADHSLVERRIQELDGTALPSFGVKGLGIADALAFERQDALGMQNVVERECGNASVGDGGRGGGQSGPPLRPGRAPAPADRIQTRLVQSGSSYISQEDKRLHFGLGQAAHVDSLDVLWPDGTTTTLTNVKANQVLSIEQPASTRK